MRAVLLLSGGFDSPVAGRMLLDGGIELEALHISFEPVTDGASLEKARALAKALGLPRLHVARIGEHLARIPGDADAHRHYFLLQKRLFYRLADALADELGCDAIATGENLGQVSSQTLQNLTVIESVARRPVLRPLLGLDKVDIIRLAKEYATHDLSLGPELCDLLGPNKPATQAKQDVVEACESRLGMVAPLPPLEAVSLG